MEEVKKIESVTKDQVSSIVKCLGFGAMIINWNDIDYEFGRGVLEGYDRCLWTKKGHRITIAADPRRQTIIASESKEPDEFYLSKKN
ncbi:MAG: hypothetical protein PHS93_08750 [Candidatus Omnitrophica bacterium]|nr:hypothetical protein [Candidatus Omnitrophota bacterium]